MGLFRRRIEVAPPAATPPPDVGSSRARKDRPTPSRREAEAARRQRVTRTLTKREARLEASRSARGSRMQAVQAREMTPGKMLMRDYVDARFSIGEFLLPSLLVILLATFLASSLPRITLLATAGMYLYILLVLLDGFFMWRGFKRVLANRLPNASTRGLAMYGMNRIIQLRRFRMPPPRVKRGDAF